MDLEGNRIWPEIVQHLNAMSMKDLARQYGVTPGAISSAMVRTGCRRRPFRHPANETPLWLSAQGANSSKAEAHSV